MSRPDYVPHEYADPILEDVRDACARTLYLSIYADAVDRFLKDDDSRQEDGSSPELPCGIVRAAPGEDWDDVVPSTGPGLAPCGAPLECVRAADDLLRGMARVYCASSRTLTVASDVAAWCVLSGRGPERFGHSLALQAQGHGVGITDDLRSDHRKADPIVRLVAALRAARGPIEHSLLAWVDRDPVHDCGTVTVEYTPPQD